ncbi:hypothetical protein HUT18_05995 [Streptomyces sp. NA04227]|uniref:hypothetical protein n=1 Tax=Streptomyces sp. NA04227 TaxID=2742136 RepID=UPI001590E7E3|nr:hypothetical protein [Streptomyces sp. NA04227]QKW06015.1 hypothetical protein HUT18_05995 [Streptomyces sp. NA04227]
MTRSLDGVWFAPVADQAPGQVGARTRFAYHEHEGRIWAEYEGGDIAYGRLVGTRTGDRIDFRYLQLTLDGATATGHCVSEITELPDGRLRLAESWQWESKAGAGTSVVEEVTTPR